MHYQQLIKHSLDPVCLKTIHIKYVDITLWVHSDNHYSRVIRLLLCGVSEIHCSVDVQRLTPDLPHSVRVGYVLLINVLEPISCYTVRARTVGIIVVLCVELNHIIILAFDPSKYVLVESKLLAILLRSRPKEAFRLCLNCMFFDIPYKLFADELVRLFVINLSLLMSPCIVDVRWVVPCTAS